MSQPEGLAHKARIYTIWRHFNLYCYVFLYDSGLSLREPTTTTTANTSSHIAYLPRIFRVEALTFRHVFVININL